MEPTTGIEPVNLFLTKEALYLLSYVGLNDYFRTLYPVPACFFPFLNTGHNFQPLPYCLIKKGGAGDEARTRDIQLGRLTLCQLSYSRRRYALMHRKPSPGQ